MANRSIVTTLRAEIGQFVASMKTAAKSTEEVGAASEKAASKGGSAFDRLSKTATENRESWTKAGTAMVAVGGSILAVGAAALKTGIAYNTLQQTSRAALTTLLGSAKAANAQMDKLDEFARNSPLSKAVFIKAQQQLIGFGLAADKVVPTLDAIQNAVAAVGGSNDDIAGIVLTLAKVKGQGKITADTLNELGIRGVDAATIIGAQMGMTGAEIRESITKGAIGADQALDALTKGMQKKFGGAAANVKNTFSGAVDRVSAAFRDLSAELASPLVGPSGGGAAVGGLNKIADVMRSFQDLPSGVKIATTGLVALAGSASFAGGSFLLLAPRIFAARTAVKALAVDMPRTSAAMSGLTKAVGAAVIALTVFEAAGKTGPSGDKAKSVEQFTAALVGVGQGSKSALKNLNDLATLDGSRPLFVQSASNIKGLKDAFDSVDASKISRIFDKITPYDDKFDTASKAVTKIDDALTALVADGNADVAAKSLKSLGDETGRSGKELLKFLPNYSDALTGVKTKQELVAESAKKLGLEVGASAEEVKKAAEAHAKLKQQTADVAMSFLDFSKGLDKNNLSFGQWIKGLDEMAKAQKNWQDNMIKASTLGATDEVLAKFQELGPAGAKMLQQMVDGGKVSVKELNKILEDSGNSASNFTDRLHDALDKIPPNVRTAFLVSGDKESIAKAAAVAAKYGLASGDVEAILKANDVASPIIRAVIRALNALNAKKTNPKVTVNDQASATLRTLLSLLGGFRSKSITLTTTTKSVPGMFQPKKATGGATGMRLPQGFAGGGVVPGTSPADPREDNVFAMSSLGNPLAVRSGEWIVNQEASEKNDKWLAAINDGLVLPKFAGGGKYSDYSTPPSSFSAQAFGNGVAQSGPQEMTVSLVGQRARLIGPDLIEFTDGRIEARIGAQSRHDAAATRRKGRN